MKIVVSGKAVEVEDALTVLQLMDQLAVETPQYVTVAVNNAFLPLASYESAVLREGDAVEFLYYMGGGCDGAER